VIIGILVFAVLGSLLRERRMSAREVELEVDRFAPQPVPVVEE
jgi:hypothetical protein